MNNILIGNVIGGLGNQMFQYAHYRALSLKLQASLYLAVDFFDGYKLHNGYELDRVFGIKTPLLDHHSVCDKIGFISANKSIRRLAEKLPVLAKMLVGCNYENNFHAEDKELGRVSLACPSYLHGYWQSEKYFQDESKAIRSDYIFHAPLSESNQNIANIATNKNSVGVHVRRGDYVSSKKNLSVHGICSVDYYCEAIANIKRLVDDPFFIFFSDDGDWVADNICPLVEEFIIVSGNKGNDSYVDMQLMSMCKHQVIANSSFSWWGAWLNNNKDKIVYAPKIWFAGRRNPIDIVPPSWIRI